MTTKKILFVLLNKTSGGAEQYLKMVANYFIGNEISIVFLFDSKTNFWTSFERHSKQIEISDRNEMSGILKFAFKTLFSKSKQYDYIFTSHVFVNALLGFLVSTGKIKTKYFVARESTSVYLRFSGLKLFIYKIAYKFGYKKMDLLICQTKLMKNQLLKHFPSIIKRTNVKVIPNPIDLHQIDIISKLNVDKELPYQYIVSAGRLIKEKGYDILIKSFATIKKEHPNLKLVILGEGVLRNDLEELISELELEADIMLLGFVENVFQYFEKARLCVVSSRIEGFPNVLLQMMSQNSNVVSTNCAGGIDQIPGLIVCESNDIKSLESALNQGLNDSNNEMNREIFNEYLNNRSITNFIKTVNTEL